MTRDAITGGVLAILREARVKDVEPALESRILEDLGFDSMSVIEVTSLFEERFEITIPLSDLPRIRTVADVVEYVSRARESR